MASVNVLARDGEIVRLELELYEAAQEKEKAEKQAIVAREAAEAAMHAGVPGRPLNAATPGIHV